MGKPSKKPAVTTYIVVGILADRQELTWAVTKTEHDRVREILADTEFYGDLIFTTGAALIRLQPLSFAVVATNAIVKTDVPTQQA